jgi:hypothetical protein
MTTPEPFDLDHLDKLHAAATVPMTWAGGKAGSEQRAKVLDAVFEFGNELAEVWPAIAAEIREANKSLGEAMRREAAETQQVIGDLRTENARLRADARARTIEELTNLRTWIDGPYPTEDGHQIICEIDERIATLLGEQPKEAP